MQADLGRTLDRIEKLGGKDFYEGETARLLAKDMKEHGGLITQEDLKAYKVIERKPLNGSYRATPSSLRRRPAPAAWESCRCSECWKAPGSRRPAPGPLRAVHYMTEAMRRYFADRSEHLGDPDFVKVPLSSMLAPKYLAKAARGNRSRSGPRLRARFMRRIFDGKESDETTHYSVADAEGNIAIVTYTLNGGYRQQGHRHRTGISAEQRNGRLRAQAGRSQYVWPDSGRGQRHTAAEDAALVHDTDYRVEGWQTVAGARIAGRTDDHQHGAGGHHQHDRFRHECAGCGELAAFHHQWLPDELRVEPGISPDTVALLEKRGYTVKRVNAQGECAAIRLNNGWLEGAADPRTEGTAEGH